MTDQELVHDIRNGDLQAFKQLVDQNEQLVFHMISRLVSNDEDREELCQDVFLRVFDKIHSFNFNAKLSTWIATIAYRQAINFIKKKKLPVVNDMEEYELDNRYASVDTPESELTDKDMQEFITQQMTRLPIHYRTVLTLFHLEQKTYPEIGEIMDMPSGTVKSYLFRGRKLLKEALQTYIGKEELL